MTDALPPALTVEEIERFKASADMSLKHGLEVRLRGETVKSLCAMAKETAELRERVEKLEAALRWYAGDGSTVDGIDIGLRAREALSP